MGIHRMVIHTYLVSVDAFIVSLCIMVSLGPRKILNQQQFSFGHHQRSLVSHSLPEAFQHPWTNATGVAPWSEDPRSPDPILADQTLARPGKYCHLSSEAQVCCEKLEFSWRYHVRTIPPLIPTPFHPLPAGVVFLGNWRILTLGLLLPALCRLQVSLTAARFILELRRRKVPLIFWKPRALAPLGSLDRLVCVVLSFRFSISSQPSVSAPTIDRREGVQTRRLQLVTSH